MPEFRMGIDQEQRQEMARQIGMPIIFSVSGGRVRAIEDGIELPVGSGYSVRVQLTAGDDYTVSRIFRRGAKEWVKGSAERVYCDDVSELVYFAGMFRSYDADQWPLQVASSRLEQPTFEQQLNQAAHDTWRAEGKLK